MRSVETSELEISDVCEDEHPLARSAPEISELFGESRASWERLPLELDQDVADLSARGVSPAGAAALLRRAESTVRSRQRSLAVRVVFLSSYPKLAESETRLALASAFDHRETNYLWALYEETSPLVAAERAGFSRANANRTRDRLLRRLRSVASTNVALTGLADAFHYVATYTVRGRANGWGILVGKRRPREGDEDALTL